MGPEASVTSDRSSSLNLSLPLLFAASVCWILSRFLSNSFSFTHSSFCLAMVDFSYVYSSAHNDLIHYHVHTDGSQTFIPGAILSSKLQIHVVNGYVDVSAWNFWKVPKVTRCNQETFFPLLNLLLLPFFPASGYSDHPPLYLQSWTFWSQT